MKKNIIITIMSVLLIISLTINAVMMITPRVEDTIEYDVEEAKATQIDTYIYTTVIDQEGNEWIVDVEHTDSNTVDEDITVSEMIKRFE